MKSSKFTDGQIMSAIKRTAGILVSQSDRFYPIERGMPRFSGNVPSKTVDFFRDD